MTLKVVERIRFWLGWCPEVRPEGVQMKGGEMSMVKSGSSGGLPKNYRIIYEERAPQSPTIRAILLGAFLFLAAVTVLSWIGIYETSRGAGFLAIVTTVIALLSWSFFNMRFRVTTEGIEAVAVPFTFKVPYTDIKEVRVMDKIPWYVGWGMRIWGRKLAYVSIHGSAVVIEKKRGVFKALLLTAKDPEKFAMRIREHMK